MRIVEEDHYRQLQRMAKLWWAGWVLAAAALLGAAWAYGRAAAYDEALVDVLVLSDDVDRLRANNASYLEDLKTFDDHLGAQSGAILEVGSYLKQRQASVYFNQRIRAEGYGTTVRKKR